MNGGHRDFGIIPCVSAGLSKASSSWECGDGAQGTERKGLESTFKTSAMPFKIYFTFIPAFCQLDWPRSSKSHFGGENQAQPTLPFSFAAFHIYPGMISPQCRGMLQLSD